MACLFCNVNKKHLLKEYTYCQVIFSNPRLMKGHLLVIPKRHIEKLSELNEAELSEMMDVTIKYQEKILKKHRGCDIRQNCRPNQLESKYKVNHVHIHLQPREFEDELYQKVQKHQISVFKDLSDEEIEEVKKELRK